MEFVVEFIERENNRVVFANKEKQTYIQLTVNTGDEKGLNGINKYKEGDKVDISIDRKIKKKSKEEKDDSTQTPPSDDQEKK